MVMISDSGRCRSKTMYQKKLHEPLAEAKPTGMKAEDWTMLDRQALGAVRLSLAKNVAYNIVNEKTIYDLFKALSNMYEKSSASNNVFLIQELVNTKMKEGASVVDHVNEFNSILSRLMSADIKFDDEIQALLLLSSLRESWLGTVTAVSGSTESTKLKFDNIRDLIIEEDICRKTSEEYSNSLLTSKDKEVHMAVRDYDDALVCCVENMVEDRIIDSGALFHATFCKEELKKFSLHSSKVRLADEKTLDIAGVGDVVLKTSFGTSWTLKDVSLVVARGNKRGSLYMVKIPSDGINAAIIMKAAVENETNLRVKCLKSDNDEEYSSQEFIEYYAENGIRMLKTVLETHQQNSVAE
ncbi:retrovirus-related pol polyprotein from transposon TNT 1-94 [Tanacetum coccineum]